MTQEKKPDGKPKNDWGCCLVWLLILGGIVGIMLWTSRDANKLGPSDDPNYDAPIGRTYGGDTY